MFAAFHYCAKHLTDALSTEGNIYFDSQSLSPCSLSPLCLGLSKAEHHGKGCDGEAVPLTGRWSREAEGKTGRGKDLILFKGISNCLVFSPVSLPFLLKFLSPIYTYIHAYIYMHMYMHTDTHIYGGIEYISVYNIIYKRV